MHGRTDGRMSVSQASLVLHIFTIKWQFVGHLPQNSAISSSNIAITTIANNMGRPNTVILFHEGNGKKIITGMA